jgi:uncharacterized protein (TIGR00269 family)
MKCRKCDQPAVINMRQHKLALCEEHFLDWIPEQTQRFIEKYRMFTPADRILVAVSGGKDSLGMWDILLRLGYQADGLTLQLGIDEGLAYSDQSHTYVENYFENFARCLYPAAQLHVVDVKQHYGESIPEVARRSTRGRSKPCAVCGLIKRHELNRIAYELGYGVLVTGHNLDDEAAVLWGNMLHWQVGYLQRQAPVLLADRPGLARKVKPLFRFYERETAAYAILRGIEYIYDECPFAAGASSLANKEALNQMEKDRPGLKLQFYLGFLRAKEEGLFAGQAADARSFQTCERCGQATTAPGLCAFCRLWTANEVIPLESARSEI